MILSNNLSYRLGCLALISSIHISAAAAELEGTLVPVGSAVPTEALAPGNSASVSSESLPNPATFAPAPDVPPPAPASDDHQPEWKPDPDRDKHDHERQMRDYEAHKRDGQMWERELDKGLKEAFGETEFDAGDFNVALLIPILAVIFIFGGPIFLVCFLMLHHYRDKARRRQDINSNIDKLLANGRDIPVELLRGDEPKAASDNGDLSRGLRNLFLGIGLMIFLTALVGFDIGAVGFILIALGLSHILIWYLNKPKVGAESQVGQQD